MIRANRTSRTNRTTRRTSAALAAVASVALLSACTIGDNADEQVADSTDASATSASASAGASSAAATGDTDSFATATLVNAVGDEIGQAVFSQVDGATEISVSAEGLAPGFHGMHIHSVGKCEANSQAPGDEERRGDFLSAGGHLHDEGEHGKHPAAGDLPSLLVHEDGTATLTFTSDRVDRDKLLGGEGTSVIIHEGPDNYANIPERYAPEGPDSDTVATGDAGARVACGVIQAP